MMSICGIPYIILEGSLNGWENWLNKLKFLKYNYNGNKNKITKTMLIWLWKVEKNYIKGWILDFYNEYKIKKEDISDLIPDIVEVRIKITVINALNNNKIKKGIIYAGIRDIKLDPNNYEFEPIVNY